MKLALINVKYSPNLGDGLLSECLELELERVVPGLSIRSIDLAGRVAYAEGSGTRTLALGLLSRIPKPLRHAVSGAVLGRALRRSVPLWRSELAGVDAAILGGGNLFSDVDLNFPLKVHAALGEVARAKVPLAVYGVGVSDNWSARGEALFREALSTQRLAYVSVRDARSAAIWSRRLSAGGVMPARLAQDPGLLVAQHVPKVRAGDPGRPTLGLGLTHPISLRYHADEPCPSRQAFASWYAAVVRGLLKHGWAVDVFTNGSPEDQAYVGEIRPLLSGLGASDRLRFMPRFPHPSALASFISGVDVVMAHRLHANIAAYSYAVPTVGLSWDKKLPEFLARIGRADFLCTAGVDDADAAVALTLRAHREGVDAARHAAVMAEARGDIAELAESLARAAGGNATAASLPERQCTTS